LTKLLSQESGGFFESQCRVVTSLHPPAEQESRSVYNVFSVI